MTFKGLAICPAIGVISDTRMSTVAAEARESTGLSHFWKAKSWAAAPAHDVVKPFENEPGTHGTE